MNRLNQSAPSDQSQPGEALPVEPASPDMFEGMTAISAVLDPDIRSFNDRRVLAVFVDKTRMARSWASPSSLSSRRNWIR